MRAYLFVALLALSACSAIVDDSTQQCKADSDCSELGLTGAVCQQSVCVSSSNAQGEQAECTTSSDCKSGSICSGTQKCVLGGCSKHSECTTKNGAASICRADGQCALLNSAECRSVLPMGAEKNDNMYLVGFMGLVEGDGASYGIAQRDGEERALNELQTFIGNLPGASGAPKRNLAMLVCDHGADGTAAANHLVNDLQVPAVLGASYSGITQKLFDIAAPKGVLVLSPAATSPLLTTYDSVDLLWRTVPNDTVQSGALKQLVVKVVDALRAKGVLAANAAPVVAMPFKGDPAGKGLLDGVFKDELTTWGKALVYDPDQLPKDAERLARAKEILDLQPDIILHLGTSEFVEYVMPLIEQMWPAGKPRPWYVVPEGDIEKLEESGKSEQLITNNGLASRLVGTSPGGRRNDPYKLFALTYRGEPGNLAEFAYDAVYLLSYAIGATKKQYPTGKELATGLHQTNCAAGPHIASGTMDFNTGWNAIRDMGCINYYGPSGELDFNQFGEAETDISVGCWQKSGDHWNFVRIDTYYKNDTKTLTPYKGAPLDFTSAGWCAPFIP